MIPQTDTVRYEGPEKRSGKCIDSQHSMKEQENTLAESESLPRFNTKGTYQEGA